MTVLVDNVREMPLKFCGGCQTEKPHSEFYKNARAHDGLQYQCKGCHLKYKRGYQPRKTVSFQKRRELLVQRAGGICYDCHQVFPAYVYDFHHLDPATKSFGVSGGNLGLSLDKLYAEADKCILLCANCHRIRHHG